MRLKSFATYGFKSFAEKTELTFDKGITAVVGPNGSGKSNISDAIRWVLGEQSAKYLRGSKMEDIIFSGSSKRRPLGVAEVTLEFNNSDHALDIDFSEVSLTRRLFRSGDSEYAINKKNCRLKDILDLLADTGLGKGSMSIIGQNRIDEVLNSRPEERRALFEEAAGIAKYRLRKKEAVRRLDETGANLTRINDIKAEVDAQVEPLRAAAEKTQQYNALYAEQRQCRLTNFVHKLDNITSLCQKLQEKKQLLERELSQRLAALSGQEAQAAQLQAEADRLNESFAKLMDEMKDKETALEKIRGQKAVLDERIINSRQSAEKLGVRNIRLEQQADELEKQMTALAAEFDVVDKKRAKAEYSLQQLQREKEQYEKNLHEISQQSENLKADVFADMQSLLEARNALRVLEQEQERRVKRREALKESITEAETVAGSVEEEYRQLLEKQARSGHEQKRLSDELEADCKQEEEYRRKLQIIRQQQGLCQKKLIETEARLNSLQRMQNSYEGFGYGIKNILKCNASWRKNIIGVAAELLQTDEKYVTAIETALGESAQNLVTLDADTAKAAINYLKQQNGGRATFLPLDNIQERRLAQEEERLRSLKGICGFAVDLVSCHEQAAKAIRFLLGRVLVAENIDAALSAARMAKFRLRVVTLDGDTINAGGSMSGGSRRHKEGYLSRGRDIKRFEALLAEQRGEMLQLQETLETEEDKQQKLSAKLQQEREQLRQYALMSSQLDLQLQHLSQKKRDAEERLLLLLDDRNAIAAEYMANRSKVQELRAKVKELEEQDSAAKQLLEDMQKKIAAEKSKVDAAENQLHDARLLAETSSAKVQLMSDRMKGLDSDTLQLRREITGNEQEQQRLQQLIEKCEFEKQACDKRSAELLQQLQETESGKEELREERLRLQNQQQQAEEQAAAIRKQCSNSEGSLKQLDIEMARYNNDREHVLMQLTEEYGLDETAARNEELLELDSSELKKRESRLATAIAALGPVNPAAIEEYHAVKERSEFLNHQYDDLSTARDNLQAVISEINSGMTRKFKEAFAEINKFFAECYIRLFGGGTAVLKLSEPDDLLNSGIDIEVQPPGKRLQSLYLLSGGERALTVIALLFALLSYRPAPFCILDEIDAALDDANIVRFSKFLRDFSQKTQFIIITHRKGTMECADIMYGVTMEESGVSKLLSVKINEKE